MYLNPESLLFLVTMVLLLPCFMIRARLYLAGGPGCSSELAVFYENGPYNIKEDLTLTPNPYGWDAAGSIIYVDQVNINVSARIMLSSSEKSLQSAAAEAS